MKIAFVCSSLEPGCDGVGDYTRRLAAELIREGHFSVALSLNDKYISDKLIDIQPSEGIDLPVLRLPSAWPMNLRLRQAKKYIDDFDPDWLSLQFVIFGFHDKGLPIRLGKQLAMLGKGKRWHIMFHELWLGMEIQTSKKKYLWGSLQRRLIKSLIIKLRPAIIHSHTQLYIQQLAKLGFTARHLPLFGNIPKVCNSAERLNLIQPVKPGDIIDMVIFGNIFAKAPVDDFINDIVAYTAKSGAEVNLTIIGRCGREQDQWANKWKNAGMKVNILGEQPVKIISKTMGTASVGISTTPVSLIEKSGSVAAMLEHNLPVICVPFPWYPKGFENLSVPPGVVLYQNGNLENIFAGKLDGPVTNSVSAITHQLINALLNVA